MATAEIDWGGRTYRRVDAEIVASNYLAYDPATTHQIYAGMSAPESERTLYGNLPSHQGEVVVRFADGRKATAKAFCHRRSARGIAGEVVWDVICEPAWSGGLQPE